MTLLIANSTCRIREACTPTVCWKEGGSGHEGFGTDPGKEGDTAYKSCRTKGKASLVLHQEQP